MSRLVVVAIVVAGGGLAACHKEEPQPRTHAGTAVAPTAPVAAPEGPEHAGVDPCAKAESDGGPIAWLHDDYSGALACARARKQPLVIDLWAPWCHTCLSMQTTVFQDASFGPDAKRFVFLALDTDREANAAALEKLAISAWPTFYVLGSADETVLARFVGGASLAQFHSFLDAGAKAAGTAPTGPDAHLLAAERALALKDLAAAETELLAATTTAAPDWPRRPDALVSLILTRAKRKDVAGCLALADKELDTTGNTAAASDFLVTAMGCADDLLEAQPAADPKHPAPPAQGKAVARAGELRTRAIARWQALLADKTSPMSIDDRSDAMASLRETLDKVGQHTDALAIAEQQRMLLDAAATSAPTPLGAMTYHWPRAEVYVYLGKPLELVPALEASAAALPKEYEPRARLGWVLWKAGKLDDAARWTDQALALVYGPRKARLLGQRADIARGQGDLTAERGYREQVVALLAALPAGQRSDEGLAHAKAQLAALDAKK